MKKILYQLRCFYPLGKLALFVKVLGLKISATAWPWLVFDASPKINATAKP
jgi:hypothetical protein